MTTKHLDGQKRAGFIPTVTRAAMLGLFAFCTVTGVAPEARAEDAAVKAMVHEADWIIRGKTTAAVAKMQIHKSAYDRAYDMVFWEDARPVQNKVILRILGPAEWRGHGTLKTEGRVTLYNPSTERMTSLSNSMLGDDWMGSHFTNDDFVKETDLSRDYTSTEEKKWSAPDAAGKNVEYHRIILKPRPTAPVRWDHILMEVYRDKGKTIPVKTEYFRRAGATVTRTLTYSGVKEIGGRTAPTVFTMTVADKPGEYTKVIYEKLKFDAEVAGSKFTEQALRQ